MSADLRVADRAHRKSSGPLAELLHQWKVVDVVDGSLGPGEGGLRGQGVVDGKRNLARAYGPGEPLLVELPGIELGAEKRVTFGKSRSCLREMTRNDGERPAETREMLTPSTRRFQDFYSAETLEPQRRGMADSRTPAKQENSVTADSDMQRRTKEANRLPPNSKASTCRREPQEFRSERSTALELG